MIMKQIETLEEAKAAVEAFQNYRYSRSKFGAADTEPRVFFETVMITALYKNEDIEPLFKGDNPWEIFMNMRGCKAVSDCLTRKVRVLVERLKNARYKAVLGLIKYYGWDY